MKKLLLPIFLLLFSTSLCAQTLWNKISSSEQAHQGITLNSQLLLDENYNADTLIKQHETYAWKNPGSIDYQPWHSILWHRVLIENTSDKNLSMVIVLDRSFTTPTDFFYLQAEEVFRSSLTEFQDDIHLNYIYPAFQIELIPGKNTILFKYLSTRENPTVTLYSNKGFAEWSFVKLSLIIFVMGMVILMAIYNLAIFITERGKEYVYYLLYLSSVFVISIELAGISRFVTQSAHIHLGPQLLALSPTFLCLFYISMFNWKETRPFVYKQILAVIIVGIVYTVYVLFAPLEKKFSANTYYLPVMLYVSILGLVVLFLEARKGSRQALLLLWGLAVLVLGTLISFFSFFGFAPEFLSYAPLISYAAEITFFSFALSVRRQEALMAEVTANVHSYGQLAKVFYPHQLEQMKAGKNLEETMPEGEAEAAVIAFDVAASSQIKHPQVKDFLHNVMKSCELEMVAHYDPQTLSSDAYRVKEMGDGFLCSVGFPFAVKGHNNAAEAAWELSRRFVKAFHQVEKEFGYHEPLFCGIGIALDKIEAYFPSSGTRQYDLYGRSIVLATRYESYRKMLFEQIEERGSVIILQEAVYQQLPESEQRLLTCFDLKASKYKIRDDYSAEKLYYCVFK